ncbi:hypothetical protein VKT23_014465 [Stygiomarasmius scandens]|uniref:Heterokaryon incompatibility domain-containing protein n=1 Tax=Marasmiellus scandens TaxID=2682957 RepID=A0ABR1J0D5_9AGAR
MLSESKSTLESSYMRLLNTETYEVKEFYVNIPLYAILSHTWGDIEITFQDIQSLNIAKTKAGWSKVKNACDHARKHTFDWIWIDSCCIDKTSSAELSEALNSMYQYYTDAEVCYVYLCDVSSKENLRDRKSSFCSSKWFTRGWTLQELIAPMYAVFLDKNWNEIGTRWSLRDAISAVTTIPVEIFEGQDIDEFSVAQKMSWAAYRETTRPEDQAYCLMGIFNVNMPSIYGEGAVKAFIRLQQEIIKISDDRSIFAWISEGNCESVVRGLFARSPKEFRASGQVTMSHAELTGDRSSFSFGNNGLRIHLPFVHDENSNASDSVLLASLHCKRPGVVNGSYLSIYLRKIGEEQYVRCYANKVVVTSSAKIEGFKEVIVKENSLSRSAKRKDGAIDIDNNREKVHFELSSSAQRLFDLSGRCFFISDPMDKGEEFTTSMRCRHTDEEEEFVCMFDVARCRRDAREKGRNLLEAVAIVKSIAGDHSHRDKGLPADRVQLCLRSGLLHVRLHMGNGRRRIEIDYELIGDLIEGSHQIALQPPNWSCMVPLLVASNLLHDDYGDLDVFLLESAIPRNFFDRDSVESDQAYICTDVNTPRLLTYQTMNWQQRFHVAVGFHTSGQAWTDIFSHQEAAKNSISDYQGIWRSYLDSGDWRTKQASASAELAADNPKYRLALTATIQNIQNTTLQLGSHLLLLDIKELPWEEPAYYSDRK